MQRITILLDDGCFWFFFRPPTAFLLEISYWQHDGRSLGCNLVKSANRRWFFFFSCIFPRSFRTKNGENLSGKREYFRRSIVRCCYSVKNIRGDLIFPVIFNRTNWSFRSGFMRTQFVCLSKDARNFITTFIVLSYSRGHEKLCPRSIRSHDKRLTYTFWWKS